MSRGAGIGLQRRLKIVWEKSHVGSSPTRGTTIKLSGILPTNSVVLRATENGNTGLVAGKTGSPCRCFQ